MKVDRFLVLSLALRRSIAFVPCFQTSWMVSSANRQQVKSAVSGQHEDMPEEMKNAFERLLEISQGPDVAANEDQPTFPMPQYSTEQLEALVKKLESVVKDAPDAPLNDSDGGLDAPFLDTDTYLQYQKNLQADGSLVMPNASAPINNEEVNPLHISQIAQDILQYSSPPVPSSYYPDVDDNDNLQDLIGAQRTAPLDDPDEIYQEIMEEEQGFQQQSPEFQDYLLSGDGRKRTEASFQIRQQQIQQQQMEILRKLDKEIEEFEKELADEPANLTLAECAKCGCILSPMDLDHSSNVCSACYGQDIADSSDLGFLEGEPVVPYKSYQKSSLPKTRQHSNPTSQPKTSPQIAQQRRQIIALQQQVERYRRQAEEAEQEVIRLKNSVADLEDELRAAREESHEGPWSETIDPDTGETFYWNEATGDMKWEL